VGGAVLLAKLYPRRGEGGER